ncbi:Hypothetical protein CINCED_3A005758 [Cinara cedri]|uniref:LisH domain-containing protein n=1 Tax=Cinara cedri TaxID=506608 RepID=A0A5E4N7C8_9HEMI|nr:Hypothetical protein CINCED_3A005758 [Cinara cedri]
MDFDEPNNSLLNSHKTGDRNSENSNIQNKFYAWFEEKGLMNNTRAHIREQLIKALKDGPFLNANSTINSSSPKVQAFNLLVADFLLNRENLFTLSVFTTEVPLLGNLDEFSSYVSHVGNNIQNKPITKPNFKLSVVQDILETLGFQPNSDVTKLTCQYYFNDKNNQIHPLVACLFKAITTVKNNLSEYDKVQCNTNCSNKASNVECDTSYEQRIKNWLASVEDILRSFNLNEAQKNTIQNLLKNYHQNYNTSAITVYKECLKKLKEKNMELVKKVADLEQMSATHFHFCESGLLFQKEKMDYITQQLRLEQLNQSINIFEEKLKSTEEKLNKAKEENKKKSQDIENIKYTLRLKEMEILKFNEESKKHMNESKTTIKSNQITFLQEQNIDLVKQLQEIKLKLAEFEKLKNIEQTNSKKIDNNLQIIESSLDREMVKKLQRENDELRDFIKHQRQRIEELSNRASNLTKQIEKAHQILPTIADYQNRNVKKKIHFVDDPNKKNSYYTNQNISSTTTDHSTTVLESDNQTEDEIIKKAHSRLKILEMNTSKAEKKFQTNTHHYTDRVFRVVDKKSYSDIRSNLSDDSDFDILKSNRNKINLKELANKIGYHRSMRRSINLSQSENDLSPGILRNYRFCDYANVTNISPIKTVSSNVNNTCKTSPEHRISPIITSSNNRENNHIKLSMDRSNNLLNQSLKENQTQIESVVINKCTNNNSTEVNDIKNQIQTKLITDAEINKNNNVQNDDNIDLHTHNLPQKQTDLQHDNLNYVDISSTSKKEQESDQTISFDSNKTDKSSDFWA